MPYSEIPFEADKEYIGTFGSGLDRCLCDSGVEEPSQVFGHDDKGNRLPSQFPESVGVLQVLQGAYGNDAERVQKLVAGDGAGVRGPSDRNGHMCLLHFRNVLKFGILILNHYFCGQTSENLFSCLFVKFVLYTAGFLGEGTLLFYYISI